MAGGVVDGQPVNQAVTNPAFLFKTADDFTIGRLGMQNTLPESGFWVESTQRYLNNIAQVIGLDYTADFTAEADSTGRDYNANGNVVPNGTTMKDAITIFANKFTGSVTGGGHIHDGTDGEGPLIPFGGLSGVRSGTVGLITGVDQHSVTFSDAMPNSDYSPLYTFRNTDGDAIFLQAFTISKSTTGFTVKTNTPPDSLFYFMDWAIVEHTQ